MKKKRESEKEKEQKGSKRAKQHEQVAKPAPKKNLLEDEEEEDGGVSHSIRINSEYAKEFERKKRREEIARLQELGIEEEESDESTSEEEDEEGFLMTQAIEKTFVDTLAKIKKKDTSIYDEKIQFFPDHDTTLKLAEVELKKKDRPNEKEKPLLLKDYETRQLLNKAYLKEDENEDTPETHVEEQKRLKNEFLKSVEGVGSDPEEEDDFLRLKTKSNKEQKEEQENFLEWESKIAEKQKDEHAKNGNFLESIWALDDVSNLTNEEKFLRNYIVREGWKEKNNFNNASYEPVIDEEEDEKNLEQTEEFEKNYNFRFEEEGADKIMTYDRNIPSSRRVDSKRKLERQRKKERKELDRIRKDEEIKRLKNLKKQEITEHLQKLAEVCGDKEISQLFEKELLKQEFDAEDYDKQMAQTFGDDYYNDENDDFTPHEHIVDEIEETFQDGNTGAVAKLRKKFVDKQSADVTKADLQAKIEEYYQLGYEDMIGDTPVRFPYKKVPANSYGLTVIDILSNDDKELNKYVSIKKLAPYMEKEWKANPKNAPRVFSSTSSEQKHKYNEKANNRSRHESGQRNNKKSYSDNKNQKE